jgi:hypothetical protein
MSTSGFQMNNINWNNNLDSQGKFGTVTANGGSTNCTFGTTAGIGMITACWNPLSFASNIFVGSATNIWGTGQCTSEQYSTIFVNYGNGLNGDYHIKPTSACASFNAGANIDLVNSKTAGVN